MINTVICGINGAVGKILVQEAKYYDNINIIGSLSPRYGYMGQNLNGHADIIIDFSNPANIDFLLEYAVNNNIPLMICTTGYNSDEKAKIEAAGKYIPVLLSSNTSVGINILRKILKSVSKELSSFDTDIIEKHHNKKIDAYSGTALTLAEDIKNQTGRQVEIQSVRAGTIPGEHTVIFAGNDEVLEIKHTAYSKKIFAKGALDIALKFYKMPSGFYTTEDMFN